MIIKILNNISRSTDIPVDLDNLRLVASMSQLVNHLVDSIQWMEIQREPTYKEKGELIRGRNYISISKDKEQEVQDFVKALLPYQVFHKPMIVKPLKHFNLFSTKGGALKHSTPLLKRPQKITVNSKKEMHPLIKNFTAESNPDYFNSVNSLQETGYRVNRKVLNAIPVLIQAGVKVDGLDYDVEALEAEFLEQAQEDINDKNSIRKEAFGENAFLLTPYKEAQIKENYLKKVKQANNNYLRTLELAKELFNEPEFYFPVYNDNRGRIYYYGKGLNPQGNILQKSLLEFKDSNLVTEQG